MLEMDHHTLHSEYGLRIFTSTLSKFLMSSYYVPDIMLQEATLGHSSWHLSQKLCGLAPSFHFTAGEAEALGRTGLAHQPAAVSVRCQVSHAT